MEFNIWIEPKKVKPEQHQATDISPDGDIYLR